MVYTVTCNPSLDYYLYLPQLPTAGVHRATGAQLTYGGKGINVSAILARLNVPTRALGFVGGRFGEKLCDLLTADGIVQDFVSLSQGETRINVKLRADAELDINAAGPTVTQDEWQALLDQMDALCADDVLVLAGAVPSGLPSDLYARLLARANGALTVVDAEGELLRRTLAYHPFLIKPNTEELGALFGRDLHTEEEIIACARRLQQEGARNVLISRGGDGALLLDETGGVHTAPAAVGTVRNTVGCGDSMVAGFIAGWLIHGDYAAALRLASACGGATAFSDTLATGDEIAQVYAKVGDA